MLTKRTADLGMAPLGPLLIRLGIPAMVGMLVTSLYNFVDTFWVARLGKNAVAALTVVFPWQIIVAAIGIGMGVGIASLVARRCGEGRTDQVNDIGGQIVFFSVAGGAICGSLTLLFPVALLRMFGTTPEILPLSHIYLTTVVFGLPALLFMMATNGLYRGLGNTLLPMVVMGSSALVNIVLDPLLIFGLGPFPRLGVQGAGLATALSQWAIAMGLAGYLWSRYSGVRIQGRHLRPQVEVFRDIAQVGAPMFAMQVTRSVTVALYNVVLGQFGAVAIAAYGLTFRILMLVFPFIFGIGQGLLPIVGFNFGARQYRRMWQALKLAAGLSTLMGAVLGVLIGVFAPILVRAFTVEPDLAALTVLAIRVLVLTMWLMAPQVMCVSALQGIGYGGTALLLSLARQLVFLVPGLLLLSAYYGVAGAFAAGPVADVCGFLVTAACMWYLYSRYRPTTEPSISTHVPPANPAK